MDFGRTLQPWNIPDTAEDLHRASIAPKSFASRDNRWKPYEYEIAPAENENLALLAEIAMLLESYGCEDVLGIRKFSPTDPEELEITESEGISIKIPWIPEEQQDEGNTMTFWAYPLGEPRLYRCSCRDTGSAENPTHNHIDSN